MAATVAGLSFDEERCAQALTRGHLTAVDLADYLVNQGVPFRTAHGQVGEAVRRAEELGCDLAELPDLDADARKWLKIGAALNRRAAIGGTAPKRVKAELARWRRRLG